MYMRIYRSGEVLTKYFHFKIVDYGDLVLEAVIRLRQTNAVYTGLYTDTHNIWWSAIVDV